MLKTIYTKFSNERSPRFSIRTNILQDETGHRYIQKCAMSSEAEGHIARIFGNEMLLEREYANTILEPNHTVIVENQRLFEFVSGKSLEEQLDELLFSNNKEGFIELFSKYADLVYEVSEDYTNIDLIPQNIIVTDSGKWVVIDYEWVFDISVLPEYIVYRAIHLYIKGSKKRELYLSEDELLKTFNITKDELNKFEIFERNFQDHVDGDRIKLSEFKYQNNKTVYDANELVKMAAENEKKTILEYRLQNFEEQFQKSVVSSNMRGEFVWTINGICNTDVLQIGFPQERAIIYVKSIVGENDKQIPLDYYITGIALGNNIVLLRRGEYICIDLKGKELLKLVVVFEKIDVEVGTEGLLLKNLLDEKEKLADEQKNTQICRIAQQNLEKQNAKLVDILTIRNEQASQLQYTCSARMWGKVMRRIKHFDPIASLRPLLDESSSGICYFIDEVLYRRNSLFIRGWVFHNDGLNIKIRVRDEKGKEIQPYIRECVRDDVEKAYDLKKNLVYGFTLIIPKDIVLTEKIYLEFETVYGYIVKEIIALGRKKDQRKRKELETSISEADYDEWARAVKTSEKELNKQRKKRFKYHPLISVIVPLYNTPLEYLQTMINSVLNQTYSNIQLCLADGSTKDEVESYIRKYYMNDARVVYKRLKENTGISGNTNEAFKLATGEFIMLCDHDDEVMPDACFEMVKALNEDSQIDAIYTDEDKMTMDGKYFFDPHFKSDFNLEFLRSNNYICHIFLIRKSIVDLLEGPFRSQFDGAQDYDFILRCCEEARRIYHVPKVLYHWRCHPLSTAENPESKSYAYEAGKNAIAASYERAGISAKVTRTEYYGRYRTEFEIIGNPKVSVVIACIEENDLMLTRAVIESIYTKTDYNNYEVKVICNEEQEVSGELEELRKKYETLEFIIEDQVQDNYASAYNLGVKRATGNYFIFMHSDVEVKSENWMKELLSYCQFDRIGICGCKILYPDNIIWSAGMVIGMNGDVGREFLGISNDQFGYAGRPNSTRNVSAVSGACMMVDSDTFYQMRGFDETIGNAYYDVDFCLKVQKSGNEIVYNAYAEVIHRIPSDLNTDQYVADTITAERIAFKNRWEKYYEQGDPCFNVNFSLNHSDCRLKEIDL